VPPHYTFFMARSLRANPIPTRLDNLNREAQAASGPGTA